MDINILSIIGMLIGIIVLIVLCFKGIPPIFVAPLSAVIVLVMSGQNIVEGITGTYMIGFGNFATKYFLVILAGAIFGSIMGDSGAAKSLGLKFARLARKSKKNAKVYTILAIVGLATVLVYGGISSFVVMFTNIAVAKELFKEMDVPWRLYGCSILGSGCIAMTMLPGTPSVPNVIAGTVLGTAPTAAPTLGIIGAVIAFCLGTIYIVLMVRHYDKSGEGFYQTGAEIAKTITTEKDEFKEISLVFCLLPCLVLIIFFNVLKQNIVVAILAGILTAVVLYWKRWEHKLETAKVGMGVAMSATCVVSMVVAFGSVISAAPGYQIVIAALGTIPGPPIIQVIIAVNIAAGFTGSASGGLTIALDSLSKHFLDMGVNPDVLHRISVVSCGGLDSLPHNGSIVNEIGVAKLTHANGYLSFGVCSVLVPLITVTILAFLSTLGIV